ncbi:Wzz/FepE/Etk N-terminal domain-containing protein [Niveispirillum sp. BGYR6]|uniref:Wzz/FepE/Etk N-terminal domain-containing protein n=1 Tax=Niveispirillum sp. BGYR6 TaxID=2971249 RepID=UPI0022B9600A|nr:Wzz/FepE/Etk N-terminal domain-containing protein [Niveispirillum sp. BGYR6]MDG5496506.1 Wzz/FepE/Etk N-terminal domain-containing protein [Niveispirillum sp. BGYR6]
MELIDLPTLMRAIRAKWFLYLGGLLVAFVLTGLVLPFLDKGYVAQATLQLRDSETPTQFSGILSSLTSSSDSYNALEAVLTSRSLADRLAAKPEMVKALGIDPQQRSLLSKVREFIEDDLFQLDPMGREDGGDVIRGLLTQKVKLSRAASGSNVVELEFFFRKQGVSQPVLSTIISEADLILRGLRISGLQERLERINSMIESTTADSTRKSLLEMHSRLSAELVSAQSLSPFAFNLIDPAAAANVRVRPSFLLIWLGLTAVLTAFITAFIILAIRGQR